MLPVEFVVPGTPVSIQARNPARRRDWKQRVANAAEAAIDSDSEPTDAEVALTVVYYYRGDRLDVDNMIKLIQDALNGVVYTDDDQVVDVRAKVRSLGGSFRLLDPSPELATAVANGEDFIHVLVTEPEDELES